MYNKRNHKVIKKEEENKHITYENYDYLFKNSMFFNYELLTKTLKINKDKRFLFFDFCEAKKIEYKYFKSNNNLLLLNELMIVSKEFRKLNNKI